MAQLLTNGVQNSPILRIEPFKGMNLSVTPTQIDQSQSPDMLNFNVDERGALNKRTGYERVFPTSLGVGAINGLYEYRRANGTVIFLIAHGTKLYTQSTSKQPVLIYTGLANDKIDFFTMNDKCYILDGINYLVYDGVSVTGITPYIPTLSISREPAGGGEPFEDFNLLGAGFKDSFSTLGEDFGFHLSFSDLDATPLTVLVDNVVKTEGIDYTVYHSSGIVLFTKPPPKGTNNVVITAYKTQAGFPERIKKCRFHTIFGGSNDTRVFIAGNKDMSDYVWRSGLSDPSYFPENGFYKFTETVKGFVKQYDYLVVERVNGKHQVTYQLDQNGLATFPSKPINDQVGTIATHSIQIVENNPVSLSKNGVYMLTASDVRDERNVSHVSEMIDTRLLAEPNLDKAVSVDFDKKYWLALNGNVYVFDYTINEWYLYDNIHANCFIERDRNLYFGSSTNGLLYRFKKESELEPYNDDGQSIRALWKSKFITFGMDERRKMVSRIFYSLKPTRRGSADIYYKSNKKSSELLKTSRINILDFRDVNFANFSFLFTNFPQEKMIKIKAKKITHFQLIIENNKVNEGLGVLSLGIKYIFQSEVK